MKRNLSFYQVLQFLRESGISTLDSNGLWEKSQNRRCSFARRFARNPQLVLDFYNLRRRQLKEVKPNLAHEILAELEQFLMYISSPKM